MSGISQEHRKKLQTLIYGKSSENILMGIELLDSVYQDINDVYDVFSFPKVPKTFRELEDALSSIEHSNIHS
jgi:hypothetical protein